MAGMIPSTLGKYRIIEEIGRGGMAVVYKAVHPRLGRYVAIKVLPRQFSFERKFVQRFHREATAASTLSHPNIVIIHDVDQEEDIHYIVMEYLEGQPLSELIKEQGSLPLGRAFKIIHQISSALDYAHSLGFVHRDIKPSNIIIGPEDHATLTDFGIVRTADGTSVTKEGAPIGTPQYMSPEQCDGKQADSRSDLYSLGVVLYEMLTGQVPFTADTPLVVMYQQVNKPPVPPRRINPDLLDPVERVVLRALGKTPEERYQTAGALAEALEAAIRGEDTAEPEPDEETVESLYMRAVTAVEEKRWQEAIGGLNEVLLLDEHYRDARDLLKRAEQELAWQQQVAELKARGERLLKERRTLAAIEVFQSALSLQPGDEELSDLLAQARRDAEGDEAEEARLSGAEELREQAKRFMRQEQWAIAVDRLQEAISLAPKNPEIASLLVQAQDGLQTQREIEDLYREGTDALKVEDWEGAIERFGQVLLKRPSHAEAREKLDEAQRGSELARKYDTAQELMTEAQWAEAIKLLETIIREKPDFKESQQSLRVARAAMSRQRQPEVQEEEVGPEPPPDGPTEQTGLSAWQIATVALFELVCCLILYGLVFPPFLPPDATPTATELNQDTDSVDSGFISTSSPTATASSTASSSPTSTSTTTHTATPTRTPRPTATPTATISSDATVYDNFDNPANDGGFNRSQWRYGSDAPNDIAQQDGVLVVTQASSKPPDQVTRLVARRYDSFSLSASMFLEARLMLDPDHHAGNVQLHFGAYLPAGDGWFSECNISDPGWANCFDTYWPPREGHFYGAESKSVGYGTWHTVGIEVDPATMTFTYYIDGEAAGSHTPVDAKALEKARFVVAIGVYGDGLTGYVDDVRIWHEEAGFPPAPTATAETRALAVPTAPRTAAGRIAFASNRDGNMEIYLISTDGSGLTRLTNNAAYDIYPSWSPDGTLIAFHSKRDGNWEIYVMNADGSGVASLTNNPASDASASWSPHGTRIAFNSNRDGNVEVYVMNADGGEVTRLTNNPAQDLFPSWSPDGTRIAFYSNRDGNDDIYVMNADGSGVTRLTNNAARDISPSWLPDGRYIAFQSFRDNNWEIYIINADGAGVRNLTNNPAADIEPRWSPDGTRIAFSSTRDGNVEIYVMNADGSDVTRLTNNPAEDRTLTWSPMR